MYALGAARSDANRPQGEVILPTPTSNLGTSGVDRSRAGRARSGTDDLTTVVARALLPTPVVTDAEGARNATSSRKPDSKHHSGKTLTDVLLPTPTVQDGSNNGGPSQFDRNSLPLNTLVTTLLPTPVTSDRNGGDDSRREHKQLRSILLPTPAANDSGNTPENHLRKKPGRRVVTSLMVLADHGLIPTGGRIVAESPSSGEVAVEVTSEILDSAPTNTDWGPYAAAIERWEAVTGQVAPSPTNADGRNGSHRLAAQFTEWMMGLEPGHVTDPAIGLTRNQMLKACGNGVVPQQATLAVSYLIGQMGWRWAGRRAA